MIVFTILGVLVFWWLMGCVGYALGMFIDVRRGLHKWTADVDNALIEVETLVFALTAIPSARRTA